MLIASKEGVSKVSLKNRLSPIALSNHLNLASYVSESMKGFNKIKNIIMFKNEPYVKQYDSNGIVTNPITISNPYQNHFPNRSKRRAMAKSKTGM